MDLSFQLRKFRKKKCLIKIVGKGMKNYFKYKFLKVLNKT